MTITAEPGVVAEGSMRFEDLLPLLTHELCCLGPYEYLETEAHDALKKGNVECLDNLLNECLIRLDEHAPSGYYFGTHPDNGACFGFWPIKES